MKLNPPTRKLREHPDLEQLRRQAKELLAADPSIFALHDAQFVLARSYGFESWPKLKAYVNGATVKRLTEFIWAGDIVHVRTMLKTRPELAGMAISYGDERRPLHFAVMKRAPEIVRLLMRHGADARKGVHPHRDATTALTIAIERGYDEIVAIIQEEEQHRREATSASLQDELSGAIASGDDARAIAMLEANPSLVHCRDREGSTPFHAAAAAGSVDLVAWLLKRGAAPNERCKNNSTPLDLAIQTEHFAVLAAMLRQAGADLTPRAAVALGEEAWLRARHSEGTLVNTISWEAGGLCTIAVKHNRPDMLALLLDFGFDPDERASSGEGNGIAYSQGFALWHCAATGKREMAETLLQRGASLGAHVDSSGSPVHSAYSHRQWEMVELFKRHGGVIGADTAAIYRQTELARQMLADEERGNLAEGIVSPGRTLAEDLLDFASSGGDPEIVRMALARIDWPRNDPRWFFFLARSLDFWNHIPWLYAANPELDRTTYLDCFRQVLERCDPNVIGAFGRTVLHEVAAMGDHVTEDEAAAFAQTLLDAGAKTDARDEILNSTPLGWACRWGRVKIAKLLVDRGADPVEADAEPWARPKAWAEKMSHAKISALLTS